MAKTDTIKVKMLASGNKYQIEKTKYDSLERMFLYAQNNMTSPCIYHLIAHIENPSQFKNSKKNLIRLFQRGLRRQYKPLHQDCPDTVIAYSIEFKHTYQKEIDGEGDAYSVGSAKYKKTSDQLPFLHIHFYVIADCKKTRPDSFVIFAKRALNEINGLRAARYVRSNKNEIYKSLKTDGDDAFSRLLYIGKIEQKSENIPFRNTFGTSIAKG